MKSITLGNTTLVTSDPSRVDAPDLLVVGHSGFIAINRNIYVRLKTRGWRVELVIPQHIPSLHPRPADPKRAEDPPIHWIEIKGSNQRFWQFDGLANILRIRRPRAIFLEADPASALAITLSKWARQNKTPLLCSTNENTIAPLIESILRARFLAAARTFRSLLMTSLTRNAIVQVFVLCNAAADSMKVLGFGDKVLKMPLGFDPAVFHPDKCARERIRSRYNLRFPVISYFGRVVPGKGLELLIEALGKMMDLDWHFLIDDFPSNEGRDYAGKVQTKIANNPALVARTQKFHADHYEIAAYMNAADIIVAPSCLPEQYGRVLAEAMACGKTVVASDAGAYPELIGDCGIIIPQANVEALTTTLRRIVLDVSLREDLGKRSSRRAVQFLSMDVQMDIIEQRLKELLPTGDS